MKTNMGHKDSKSQVYFMKVNSPELGVRVESLKKLLQATENHFNFSRQEIVPVKITIGDSACVYNIHPELVKVVVSLIKEKGAKPFLFDTSVIYHGERQNAVDHLNLAQSKGFGHNRVGAPFVIADGLLGQDGREITIDAAQIKKIKTPSFVGMLDSLVVLSHATGHIVSGFAAALKNVAMGMSCRSSKQVQHSSLKPSVMEKKCTACGLCIANCPVKAIAFKNNKANIDRSLCIGCGECLCFCKFDAIFINWEEEADIFVERMAEVAGGILAQFKNKFFITFALDVTKECDCISGKNELIASRDIGILASTDPLALDKATAFLVKEFATGDHWKRNEKVYEHMFTYAASIGVGSLDYQVRDIS